MLAMKWREPMKVKMPRHARPPRMSPVVAPEVP
jgi:hypothetical protein